MDSKGNEGNFLYPARNMGGGDWKLTNLRLNIVKRTLRKTKVVNH